MNKFQHSLCNDVLGAPAGVPIEQCGALPVWRSTREGVPVVCSFWKPDKYELAALNAGRAVVISVQGRTHAPLCAEVCLTE